QKLSLPLDQLVGLVGPELEQAPPANYVPVVDKRGIAASHHHASMRYYNLVPLENATHVAVANGEWTNPSTWLNNKVPSAGARVVIPRGVTVQFNAFMQDSVSTLRIDGSVNFSVNVDTQLKADTIVVTSDGKLHIGEEANPIRQHVAARIVISSNGP